MRKRKAQSVLVKDLRKLLLAETGRANVAEEQLAVHRETLNIADQANNAHKAEIGRLKVRIARLQNVIEKLGQLDQPFNGSMDVVSAYPLSYGPGKDAVKLMTNSLYGKFGQ